jgi:hypothetical protein
MSSTTSYKEAYIIRYFKSYQASQELNIDSYVIGGFVRDLILEDLKRHRYCSCWKRNRTGTKSIPAIPKNQKFKF